MTNKTEGRFPDPHDLRSQRNLKDGRTCIPRISCFLAIGKNGKRTQFWFQDKIHAPEAIPPLDHIFQEAWQISLSQYTTRVFCIPPAQGIAQRMVGCYLYICAIAPPPDEVQGAKAERFGARVFPVSKTMTSCGKNGW
jgi:pyruvate,water dikinase